jgi:hypothetical protein
MPGPAGAEHRLSAVKLRAAPAAALWMALTAPQFSRFAEVPVARPLLQVVLAQGQTTELDHRAPVERNQNPAKPSGLLWRIVTLVPSSSAPSCLVA